MNPGLLERSIFPHCIPGISVRREFLGRDSQLWGLPMLKMGRSMRLLCSTQFLKEFQGDFCLFRDLDDILTAVAGTGTSCY